MNKKFIKRFNTTVKYKIRTKGLHRAIKKGIVRCYEEARNHGDRCTR